MKITRAQRTALDECFNGNGLWCSAGNLWRWYRSLPNGMIYQCASNPTIVVLKQRGFVKAVATTRVEITPEGLAALHIHQREVK